jgi:hypothetical protein
MKNDRSILEKVRIVREIERLVASGKSYEEAGDILGISKASAWRWPQELAAAGGDAWAAFSEDARPHGGRPASFDLTDDELAIARWHRLAKGSMPIAMEFFARDERVRPEVREGLREIEERAFARGTRPAWPISIRRAFHVTAEEIARFRGKKAMANAEMVSPRGMIYLDAEGVPTDILPGELWELDDYSGNQPFCYLDPETGGLELGRQILAGVDVCSAGWLGFDLIGRPRDAYRGEDIVRFIARLVRAHGLPRFLRLEKGSWESTYIHGLEVEGLTRPWGALDALFHIEHTWKSKGKGLIEGGFDHLQNWLAHAGRDVGRFGGEFEEAAKAWRQAKQAASRPDPRALGFWEQADCAAAHEAAARIINSRPKDRRCFGERVSPDDLRGRLGWHAAPLPAAEAWRLLPVKQRRVVNGGVITARAEHWPEMRFVINGTGEGLHLDTGHVVLIAFDPADPAAGAFVANGDRSARNRAGWGMGQILCAAAPLLEAAPQIDLSGRRHGTLDLRRRAAAAAATEFRAIRAAAPGPRESSAFTGDGRAITAGTLPPAGREPAEAPRVNRLGAAPAGRMGLAAVMRGERFSCVDSTDETARVRDGVGLPVAGPAAAGTDRMAALRAAQALAAEQF